MKSTPKSARSPKKGLAAGSDSGALRTRTAFERMYRIFELIRGGTYPNTTTLKRELKVTERTLFRDLDHMRDRMGLPIAYDPVRYGFYFTAEVGEFPMIHITTGELLGLCVARMAMGPHRGTSFEKHVRGALEKITRHMRDEISFRWEELDGAISFRGKGEGAKMDLKLFEAVSEAVLERREIEFAYRKLENGAESRRQARPHSLTCVEGTWYLLAQDLPKLEARTFALSRMSGVKKTRAKFERDPALTAEAYLAHSIGIYHGGKPQRVRLRAKGLALRFFEERPLHSSQKVAVAPGGAEGEVALQVAVTPELERAILGWGAQVQVLEPESLRQAILRHAEEMVRNG